MNRNARIMLSFFFMGSLVASDNVHRRKLPLLHEDVVKLILPLLPPFVLRGLNKPLYLKHCIVHVYHPITLQSVSKGGKKARQKREGLCKMISEGRLYMYDFWVLDNSVEEHFLIEALKQKMQKFRILGRATAINFLNCTRQRHKYALRDGEEKFECVIGRNIYGFLDWSPFCVHSCEGFKKC